MKVTVAEEYHCDKYIGVTIYDCINTAKNDLKIAGFNAQIKDGFECYVKGIKSIYIQERAVHDKP